MSSSSEQQISDIHGRAYDVLLVSIVAPAITCVFIACRFYVRLAITKAVKFDDSEYLIAQFENTFIDRVSQSYHCWSLTKASIIAYSVLQGLATRPQIGVGTHLSDFVPSQESEYYKWVYMFDSLYITSLFGYKTSILLLYIRVFGIRKHFRWLVYAVLFVVDGYLIACLIVQIAGCQPPHKFWDRYVQGNCVDFLRFDIAYGCLNIVTDFIIAVLPLGEIWRLFMPITEKVWASLIFGSAILAFAAAAGSQIYRLRDLFSSDRTYDAAITFIWQTVEINTGLIVSCFPTLRPLYRKTVEVLTATFTGRSSDSIEREHLRKEVITKEREMIEGNGV
ncbi:hypothetical protein MMC10_004624 [Thelotrema lepadinum]|nr:hypothetical protein [Thelotrema lepadinum]